MSLVYNKKHDFEKQPKKRPIPHISIVLHRVLYQIFIIFHIYKYETPNDYHLLAV